jgi:HAD superfamily hydrolase (TIGR01490 family)
MSELREAAFFDLDKTLMAGSSGMEFARVARRRGLITRSQIFRWARDHFRYRLKGATDEQTVEVLKMARETLSNVSAREIERMWPEVLAGILPRVYPEMLAEIQGHQDAGRMTFIVSAAGNDMVEALAGVLGMDGGVGTRYVVSEEGVYTGQLDGRFVYGPGKVEAMRELADEHDLDLAASWAYSDSTSDLPMLDAVGNAVVVNPDAPLVKVARERGWRIIRFDRLGRNLTVAGSVLLAALLGGTGSYISKRRRATAA